MAREDSLDERCGSLLQLPVSTSFADIRAAYRHLFWHRRGAVSLSLFYSATIVLQGMLGFYRLVIGADSRTDLLIFAGGTIIGVTLYSMVTDACALAAAAAARSHHGVVTMCSTGVELRRSEGPERAEWSSLKQICFTSSVLAIQLPQTAAVISLSDISTLELRRLRRILVAENVHRCGNAEAHVQRPL